MSRSRELSSTYVVQKRSNKEEKQAELKKEYIAGIDVGVDNLIALTANKPAFQAVVVNGRPVKSTNQYYNKRRAELQKALGRTGTTARMERMTNKRNRRIEHYMHTTSKRIIDVLVKEGIGVLCIGKNDGWKQEANMGKRNNQQFCFIPHAQLISMLKYKAELVGIKVYGDGKKQSGVILTVLCSLRNSPCVVCFYYNFLCVILHLCLFEWFEENDDLYIKAKTSQLLS